MDNQTNIWPKHITVDKRIVKILSGSTYTNFPSAIREIISNSYDADAENVTIDVDLKKEIIAIRDDGHGMNESDFAFYLRIAGKSRKKDDEVTKARRKIIGQFGVGFLSALPFCQKYIIETKRKGSGDVLFATISSDEYFSDQTKDVDIEQIEIFGSVRKNAAPPNEHFTRIRLVGFSRLTKAFFAGDYSVGNRRSTVNNFSPLELLKWEMCEYLPLRYKPTHQLANDLNRLFDDDSLIPFNVLLDGDKIYRNIHGSTILEQHDAALKIGNIAFKFAILTNYSPIAPTEARFLMLRNRNTGVGARTTFELGLDGKVYAKLAHLTGEVNILNGVNDLISVSRDKFNFSPDYEKLKEYLRKRLAYWANDLDNLKSSEKLIADVADIKNIGSLETLNRDRVLENIGNLERIVVNQLPGDDSQAKIKIVENAPVRQKSYTQEEPLKKLAVLSKKYTVIGDNWASNDPVRPAIKIDGSKLMVNESYPLFRNKKFFDVFLKLHILLLSKTQDKSITEQTYSDLMRDLLKTFDNY